MAGDIAENGTVTFKSVNQFYDGDDPSPEESRDLSDRAEDRIFYAVVTAPGRSRSGIARDLTIRIPAGEFSPGRAAAITAATKSYFLHRAREVDQETKLIKRAGFREVRLTVAFCVPAFIGIGICSQFRGDPLIEIAQNVLIILSWVMIWQPFQSLVFDRWTAKERAAVYRKIAGMPIEVLPPA